MMREPDKKRYQAVGPEIAIKQEGVPCGLFQKRTEPGFMLADGTVLLETEKDAHGHYKGGAGMDGMYLSTGQLYTPVFSEGGTIRAFREIRPERENHLAGAEMSSEQNYNMIDGIPNNEPPRKTTEPEQKPSILESLRKFQKENGRGKRPEVEPPGHDPVR